MINYNDLVSQILTTGELRGDRTGVGTKSIFGTKLTWDLQAGFPATTCKRLAWKTGVVPELLWFLSGSTNVNDLREIIYGSRTEGTTIWDGNYNKQAVDLGYTDGNLGPIYGYQFYRGNQLNDFIHRIQTDPNSRRHIISLWNVTDIEASALPPCHGLVIQANVRGAFLDMQWYQRSVDTFLGLPFNIASYALFTHIIASIVGLKPGKLTFLGGDTHLYTNSFDACKVMLSRTPKTLPILLMPTIRSLGEALSTNPQYFRLVDYDPHPAIRVKMAV